jgi:hypothetical protein
MVFWTCLIEIGLVDAHPKLPTSLGDDYKVSQPPWMMDLLDEASFKQLLDFFTDGVLLPNGLLPWFLLGWSGVGVDLQMVLNQSLGIPDICDGCQANTSILAWRKVTRVSSYLLSRSPVMRVVWAASAPIWMAFMGTSSLPLGCTWGAGDEPHWRELEGSWRQPPGPAATSC